MKEYKAFESWNTDELEATLNEYAKQGYVLTFYQSHKDGNMTNEKHFAVMEKAVGA